MGAGPGGRSEGVGNSSLAGRLALRATLLKLITKDLVIGKSFQHCGPRRDGRLGPNGIGDVGGKHWKHNKEKNDEEYKNSSFGDGSCFGSK